MNNAVKKNTPTVDDKRPAKKKQVGAVKRASSSKASPLRRKVKKEESVVHKESEQSLVDSLPFPVDIVDEKGNILYMNLSMERVAGKHARGKSCWLVYKDDRTQCLDCPLKQPIKLGEAREIESVGVMGGRIYKITHTGILYQGQKAVLEFFQDVTATRQTEERAVNLHQAVQSSRDVVFLTNPAGIITYINPEFTNLYGYTADEIVGKVTPRVLKSGAISRDAYRLFWETILSGKPARAEYVNKTKDGRLIQIDGSASPIFDPEGNLTGFVALQRDIAERKQAENTLQRQYAYLDALYRAIPGLIDQRDPNAVLQSIIEQISNLLETTHVTIAAVDLLHNVLIQNLSIGKFVSSLGYQTSPGQGIAGRVWKSGVSLVVPDYSSWDGRLPEFKWIKTAAGFPMKSGGEVTGVIVIAFDESGRAFTKEETDILQRLADLASAILHNAELHTALQHEIGERTKVEQALKELGATLQERQFVERLTSAIPDVVYIVDLEKKETVFSNRELFSSLGYNADSTANLVMSDLVHPDDLPLIEQGSQQVVEASDDQIIEMEYRVKHANGGWHWLRARNIVFYRDENGKVKQFLGVTQDITERKQAEEKYRTIFENATEGIYQSTPDGRFLSANPAMARMLGFSSPQELINGVTNIATQLFVYPEERDRFFKTVEDGRTNLIEAQIYKRDGSIAWFSANINVVHDDDGNILYYEGVMRDVTERKRAEEQLRISEERWKFAIAGSSDGIFDWNISTNEVFRTSRWSEILGVDEHDMEPHANDWSKRVHPDDLVKANRELERHFRRETDVYQAEYRALSKDGTYKWILDRGRVLAWNVDGTPSRMVGTHTDITERKRVEEALRESEARFKGMVNTAFDAIISTDENQNIILFNTGAERVFGWSVAEVLGKSLDMLVPPESIAAHRNLMSTYGQSQDETARHLNERREIYARRRDNSIFPIEISISKVAVQGRNIYTAILRDVTERMQMETALYESEERYRLISTVASDYVFSTRVSPEGIPILDWVAGSFETITGYSYKDYLTYGGWRAHLHPDDLAVDDRDMENLRANHKIVSELRTYKKSGELVWVRVYARPIWDNKRNQLRGIYGAVQDITRQKQAEEELRIRDHIIASSLTGLAIVDTGIKIAFVNDAWLTMFGFDATEEVLGTSPVDHVQQRLKAFRIWKTVNEQGYWIGELTGKRRDNSTFEFETTINAVKNEDGTLISYIGSFLDVTRRKQAEAELRNLNRELEQRVDDRTRQLASVNDALQESQDRYEQVTRLMSEFAWGGHLMPDGSLSLDWLTPSVKDVTGYAEDEFVANEVWKKLVHADDLDAATTLYHEATGSEAVNSEGRFVTKDGKQRWVQTRVWTETSGENGDMRLLGMVSDITERKQIEQELHRLNTDLELRVLERTKDLRSANELLSALEQAAIAVNKSLRLDDVLDQILEQAWKIIPCRGINLMFIEGDHAYISRRIGYDESGQMERDLPDFQYPLFWTTFASMMEGTGIVIPNTDDHPQWHMSSATQWVRSFAGAPLRVDEKVVGFLNASHDEPGFFNDRHLPVLDALAMHASLAIQKTRLIDELRETLKNEKKMRNQLVQADKLVALGKMVAVIAHEINNPIQTIKNAFYLLKDQLEQNDEAGEYLNIASREANRIAELIEQLRETYRPRSKTFTMVNLVNLISEVKILLEPQFKKQHVSWEQPQKFEPCTVFGVSNNLKQIFINICMNALEAMETDGKGSLTIDFHVSPDNRRIGVEVKNTGPSIPPEVVDMLFEPFFTTKGVGTGLGLSISYEIARHHNGEIFVKSNVDKEVSFIVWLPLILMTQE